MELPAYAKREIEFPGTISEGARGMRAKRVQEWLSLHGIGTAVDADFGPATKRSVRDFQTEWGLPVSGRVTGATWEALTAPMQRALEPQEFGGSVGIGAATLGVAARHLVEHPREVGGKNAGPWVRLYMDGNDGEEWLWCAGFVTFMMKLACGLLGVSTPIRGSFSCDSLKHQASAEGLFVRGRDVGDGSVRWSELGVCQFFLVRRTSTDWTHTGLSHSGAGETFATIEGNTNDDGHREGYEVCARTRGLGGKDFILMPS